MEKSFPGFVDCLSGALRIVGSSCRLAEAIRPDGDFHLLFCEFLGNREILDVMRRSKEKIFWVIWLVFRESTTGRLTVNWEEHQKIADAVFQGSATKAIRQLEEHFEYGKRALLSHH